MAPPVSSLPGVAPTGDMADRAADRDTERVQLTVLGVPTSAGAHHAGQELTPAALRAHGLVERLAASGIDVVDAGDVEGEVFRPDAVNAVARNVDAVVRVAGRVAGAVEAVVRSGRVPLVVGGDCTITVGVVAGLQRVRNDVRVAYLDGDADVRPPHRGGSGILDATGVAHLLGIATTPLAAIGPHRPMLRDEQIVLVGYDPGDPDAVDPEELASRPALRRFTFHDVRADPVGVARQTLESLGPGSLVVHLDVDALDSADLPLANFPHYGTGITVAMARQAWPVVLGSPDLAAVVLTEVNPTHDPGGDQLERYVDLVVGALSPASTG